MLNTDNRQLTNATRPKTHRQKRLIIHCPLKLSTLACYILACMSVIVTGVSSGIQFSLSQSILLVNLQWHFLNIGRDNPPLNYLGGRRSTLSPLVSAYEFSSVESKECTERQRWTELKCQFSCVPRIVQSKHTGSSVHFSSVPFLCRRLKAGVRRSIMLANFCGCGWVSWENRPMKSLNHDTHHFWRHDGDDKKWQTDKYAHASMLLAIVIAKQHKKRTVCVRRWLLICWSCICSKVNWSAYFGV